MQVQFNKPVTLGGDTFGKGQHNVSAEFKKDWFFNALLKDGDAVILREDAPSEAKATRKTTKTTEAPAEEVSTAEGQ